MRPAQLQDKLLLFLWTLQCTALLSREQTKAFCRGFAVKLSQYLFQVEWEVTWKLYQSTVWKAQSHLNREAQLYCEIQSIQIFSSILWDFQVILSKDCKKVFSPSWQSEGLFPLGIQKVRVVANDPLRAAITKYTFHKVTDSLTQPTPWVWTPAPQTSSPKGQGQQKDKLYNNSEKTFFSKHPHCFL